MIKKGPKGAVAGDQALLNLGEAVRLKSRIMSLICNFTPLKIKLMRLVILKKQKLLTMLKL